MEITINDQPLEITLEQEKTLGEVIKGLEVWLETGNLVVFSAHADAGTGAPRQDLLATQGWESLPVAGIRRLRVTATHADELLKANLHTVEEFLTLLEAALAAADEARIEELIGGIPYLGESIRRQFSPDLRPDLERLTELLGKTSSAVIAAWPPHIKAEALRLISALRERVRCRLREMEEPKAVLRELSAELGRCSGEIGEVAVLLQTGRDREAMARVISFSDLSGRLARILAYARNTNSGGEPGHSLQSFYTDLNTVLEELVEAFQSRDSVLIGDLLEYEIAPRLETLKAMVGELL